MQAKLTFLAALSSALFCASSEVRAEDVCEVVQPLSGQRLLRRLSLDLRDRVPNREEIELQTSRDDVPESTVDAFLDSEAFLDVMDRYHSSLLWPNIDQVALTDDVHKLYAYPFGPNLEIWMSPVRAVFERAVSGSILYLPCKPEPAEFDENGEVVAEAVMMGQEIIGYQEGYVEVEPYWAPGTTVKVCAFDAKAKPRAQICPGPTERYPFVAPFCEQYEYAAQIAQLSPNDREVDCDSQLALFAPECGCGPNLRYCTTLETEKTIKTSLLEQMLRIVRRTVEEDRPYTDALTDKRIEYNGPVVHYLKYLSRLSFDLFADPDSTAPYPQNLEYTDADDWIETERGGRHAGVLTAPGYLLKFQSNRARAHRYYNAFECSSFIPSGPLPSPFEPCSQELDLSKRCGCDACHKTLEPMSAHFGRFSEYGFSPLDELTYPRNIGDSCIPPIDGVVQLFRCFRFYDVENGSPTYGQLLPYHYRTPAEVQNIELGPTKLVQGSIDSGKLSACTIRKLWTHFLRRAPTSSEEQTVIPELIQDFERNDRAIRTLVKALVLHPAYRRLP